MVLNTVEAPYIIADVAFQGPGSGITGFAPGLTTGDSAAVFSALASTASGQGAALVGDQSPLSGSVPTTQHAINQAVIDLVATFGADPTGATDSSSAWIVAALTASTLGHAVIQVRGIFKISNSVSLYSNTSWDCWGSTINFNVGANPGFKLNAPTGSGTGLSNIHIEGGVFQGTAGSFLQMIGCNNAPAQVSDWNTQIRLEGLNVTGSIGLFLDMQKSNRQLFIDECQTYTTNGISAGGVSVEVMISKSIIFGATGGSGTYGIEFTAGGTGVNYHQGWQIDDCTIDNFATCLNIHDIFVIQVDNSYIGGASGLGAGNYFSVQVAPPVATNLTQSIKLTGCTFYAPMQWSPSGSGGGQAYDGAVSACNFESCPGYAIYLGNNASNISLESLRFTGAIGSNPMVIQGLSNNNLIAIGGIACDATYLGANTIISLPSGVGSSVRNVSAFNNANPSTAGNVSAPKAVIQNVTCDTAFQAAQKMAFTTLPSSAVQSGTQTLFVSETSNWGRGETGDIVIHFSASGMSVSQAIYIVVPTGMVIPTQMGLIFPGVAAQEIDMRIPYYCTADITAGAIGLWNQAGNTVTFSVNAGANCFGFVRT